MSGSLFLAGCSLVLAAVQPVAAQGDRELLLQVGRIVARGDAAAAGAWPGFGVPTTGILCAPDGLTLVVGAAGGPVLVPEPPAGLDPVCFDLSYRMGEDRLVAVPLIEDLYTLTDPVLANLAQLYHEAFHGYQGAAFGNTRGSGYAPHQEVRIPVDVINAPEFAAMAGRERELLAEALEEPDPSGKRRILERYVAIRRERMALVPAHLRGAEAHHERKEGTANLVGLTLAFAAKGLPADAVRETIVDDLRSTPAFSGRNYMQNAYRQWHIYATGAAMGLLLQDFAVEWRERVEDGWTPYALLLKEVLPGHESSVRDAFHGARAAHGIQYDGSRK